MSTDIFFEVKEEIKNIVIKSYSECSENDFDLVVVETPKNKNFGDLSTNAPMILCKKLKQNPMTLAGEIISKINSSTKLAEYIESSNVAGGGFINFKIKKSKWVFLLNEILKEGINFGYKNLAREDKTKEKINVEYVSCNPTGPMHIGHVRCAVFGDVIAKILNLAGYKVTKEFYINDFGNQVSNLGKSVYLRYLEIVKKNKSDSSKQEDSREEEYKGEYRGKYIIDVAKKLYEEFGDSFVFSEGEFTSNKDYADISNPEYNIKFDQKHHSQEHQNQHTQNQHTQNQHTQNQENSMKKIIEVSIQEMMSLIIEDLKKMDVQHDIFFSEKTLHETNEINKAIEILSSKGLIYKGILPPPKGEEIEDYEPKEQLLFKSTNFGDDQDRVIQKSDGTYPYFSADIGYAKNKIERGYNELIIILGADHIGYIKRFEAMIKAISDDKVSSQIKTCSLVNYIKNGEQLRMSKRAGNFTTADEVIREVGSDAIRYMMVSAKANSPIDFDLDLVKEQNKDNPIFYIQYAIVRINSVLRNAKEKSISSPDSGQISATNSATISATNSAYSKFENKNYDLSLLSLDEEIEIIKMMSMWPKIFESSVVSLDPHKITNYIHELASLFHSLWNLNKDGVSYRIIVEDKEQQGSEGLAFENLTTKILSSEEIEKRSLDARELSAKELISEALATEVSVANELKSDESIIKELISEGIISNESITKELDAKELTASRLALIQGIKYVLSSGLNCIGIKPLEKM